MKIWRVIDGISGDDNSKVTVKEVFRFTPVCKGDKKVKAVTTSTFAPSTMTMQHDGKSWEHGVFRNRHGIWIDRDLGYPKNTDCLLHNTPGYHLEIYHSFRILYVCMLKSKVE